MGRLDFQDSCVFLMPHASPCRTMLAQNVAKDRIITKFPEVSNQPIVLASRVSVRRLDTQTVQITLQDTQFLFALISIQETACSQDLS